MSSQWSLRQLLRCSESIEATTALSHDLPSGSVAGAADVPPIAAEVVALQRLSARCQQETHALQHPSLLNHLVGAGEQ